MNIQINLNIKVPGNWNTTRPGIPIQKCPKQIRHIFRCLTLHRSRRRWVPVADSARESLFFHHCGWIFVCWSNTKWGPRPFGATVEKKSVSMWLLKHQMILLQPHVYCSYFNVLFCWPHLDLVHNPKLAWARIRRSRPSSLDKRSRRLPGETDGWES